MGICIHAVSGASIVGGSGLQRGPSLEEQRLPKPRAPSGPCSAPNISVVPRSEPQTVQRPLCHPHDNSTSSCTTRLLGRWRRFAEPSGTPSPGPWFYRRDSKAHSQIQGHPARRWQDWGLQAPSKCSVHFIQQINVFAILYCNVFTVLSAYYIPGPVLGTVNTTVRINTCSHGERQARS